jgi:hypothetical protein
MGLDLLVESCARAGHEAEWRRLIESSFAGEPGADTDNARFREISIPPYERVGAPRVGQDVAADAWILKVRGATTPEETAEVLKQFEGYYALALVTSDGVPKFSHAGFGGVDETSFRGAFLSDCGQVLPKRLIDDAWNHKLPEAAVAYGQALLAAAEATPADAPVPPSKKGILARLGLAKPPEPIPLDEQLEIVQAAGRWYVFWGERGHAIRAWF